MLYHYYNDARHPSGTVAAGALISIREDNAGTGYRDSRLPLATIYLDADGTEEAAGTALHQHADVDVTYNPRRNWLG